MQLPRHHRHLSISTCAPPLVHMRAANNTGDSTISGTRESSMVTFGWNTRLEMPEQTSRYLFRYCYRNRFDAFVLAFGPKWQTERSIKGQYHLAVDTTSKVRARHFQHDVQNDQHACKQIDEGDFGPFPG